MTGRICVLRDSKWVVTTSHTVSPRGSGGGDEASHQCCKWVRLPSRLQLSSANVGRGKMPKEKCSLLYVKGRIFGEWKLILFENKWWKGATLEPSTILPNSCGQPDNASGMMLGKAGRADLRHPVGDMTPFLVLLHHCAPPAMPISSLGYFHWPLVRHWGLSLEWSPNRLFFPFY